MSLQKTNNNRYCACLVAYPVAVVISWFHESAA